MWNNAKLSLYLIKYDTLKHSGGVEVKLHSVLTSALGRVNGQLYLQDTHCMGPRAGLDATERRKTFDFFQKLNFNINLDLESTLIHWVWSGRSVKLNVLLYFIAML
jgi:hypothetical protein